MELNDLAAPGTTFSGCGDAVRAILESAADVERVASDTLTPRMLALIELAVALAIPNREMASIKEDLRFKSSESQIRLQGLCRLGLRLSSMKFTGH
jgi:hypothetical protein